MSNDLFEVISSRRSIRQFTDQPVARELILTLIDSAGWAPSNHNRQGWKFIALENREEIRILADRVEQALQERVRTLPSIASSYASGLIRYATLFKDAPVLIVALHKRPTGMSMPMLETLPNPALVSGEALSTAMAVQNLLLAAHARGLGACVMTGPLLVPEALAQLDLPPGFELNCFVALGYPAESPAVPRRKELDQIMEFRNYAVTPANNENGTGNI